MLLNGTGDQIDAEDYPLTTAEVIDRYGDHEIRHQNGSERLVDILERTEPETYENADELRFVIYACVTGEAIGRKGYCDRDPTPPGVDQPYGPLSF